MELKFGARGTDIQVVKGGLVVCHLESSAVQ